MPVNNISDLITIRTMKQTDVHFVLDSIIQSLSKYTESIFKGWSSSNIFKHLELLALYALMNVAQYSVFLACHKDDTEIIIGYIVADPLTNHIVFQYTKYSYRKLGIQKNLLMPLVLDESRPIVVNWPTKEMLKLCKAGKVEIVNLLLEKLINETYHG